MSEMITDLVTAYKFGLKQLYYFNTFDGAGELEDEPVNIENNLQEIDEDDCESCVI
jgi:ribonucleoside-diphosphate reductase alpha chain